MRLRSLGIALLAGAACAGCPNKETIGTSAIGVLGRGVINDPRNKSLRFDVLKFGLERFCTEMTRRGMPLKLRDDEPVIGRFFADSCQSQVIDEDQRKAFVVQFAGKGYAWTNVTGRIGFRGAGLVEYAPDFQMHDDAMYIYFRPRNASASSFSITMVEAPVVTQAATAFGISPEAAGRRAVDGQLERGFTVVRWSGQGDIDFGLGFVAPGEKPYKPFEVTSRDKKTLLNERTEVHGGQQDVIGGFEVEDDDQALYFTLALDGAPAVDVFVVQKGAGDPMVDRLVTSSGPAPLTFAPLLDEPLAAGQPWKRFLRVPKGLYYLVIDNSSVGRTQPQAGQGDERAAKVDYVIQLGDEP